MICLVVTPTRQNEEAKQDNGPVNNLLHIPLSRTPMPRSMQSHPTFRLASTHGSPLPPPRHQPHHLLLLLCPPHHHRTVTRWIAARAHPNGAANRDYACAFLRDPSLEEND